MKSQFSPEILNEQLREAVKEGDANKAGKLISQGADPNLKDDEGNTLLMQAVAGKKENLAKTLLDHDAEPDLKNDASQSALLLAIAGGNAQMVKLLVRRFAEITHEAVEMASESGNPLLSEVLDAKRRSRMFNAVVKLRKKKEEHEKDRKDHPDAVVTNLFSAAVDAVITITAASASKFVNLDIKDEENDEKGNKDAPKPEAEALRPVTIAPKALAPRPPSFAATTRGETDSI